MMLLLLQMYGTGESGEDVAANLNPGKITHLVEHPVPIEPPVPEAPAAPMPLMLTKKACFPLISRSLYLLG